MESEFVEIREKLKRYIPWVDTAPVPESMQTSVAETRETLAVHAQFEMDGLYAFWRKINAASKVSVTEGKNIDELWIDREVIPRWERYAFIVSCFSFLEDQLKPLLAENPDLISKIYRKVKPVEEQLRIVASKYRRERDCCRRNLLIILVCYVFSVII
jgi:hypothetical protein